MWNFSSAVLRHLESFRIHAAGEVDAPARTVGWSKFQSLANPSATWSCRYLRVTIAAAKSAGVDAEVEITSPTTSCFRGCTSSKLSSRHDCSRTGRHSR